MECRIVRMCAGHLLFGVAPVPCEYNTYLGYQTNKKGKGYLCVDGSLRADQKTVNGLLPTSKAGDCIGVTLDMNNKTVCFSKNGKKSETKPLDGDAFYLAVSAYDTTDIVEILPKYCWSKN
mmetsp:Transcript_16867/g.18770  ORF Transcript_16867/g.18770 Transcript_16867/m.18770 type:complete len:121 (+) Transcript_16867:660-1022(+)